MSVNQLSEKLNHFHNTSIKNGQILGQLNANVTKKLSDLNSSWVNQVAKNMQSSAVEFMNSKKVSNPLNLMKINGDQSFLQEIENYQQHLNDAVNEYMEEFSSANEQLLGDSRAAFNEFMQLTSQNVPDGMDGFIKPYQVMIGSLFEGAAIANGLSKSYLTNIKKNYSANGKSSKNIILSEEVSEK